eukprot:14030919-Ditylum_brightwellii.AAC.1
MEKVAGSYKQHIQYRTQQSSTPVIQTEKVASQVTGWKFSLSNKRLYEKDKGNWYQLLPILQK